MEYLIPPHTYVQRKRGREGGWEGDGGDGRSEEVEREEGEGIGAVCTNI